MALKLTNNDSANLVFDLINRAEQFGDRKIDMIVCKNKIGNDEVWFKGKNIASVLGYKKPLDALDRHVKKRNQYPLNELYVRSGIRETRTPNLNEESTIYINEPGLYQLIMKSKLPAIN
jgi:prophage antirepressor-like protein